MKSIFAACLIVAASSPFCLAEEIKLETDVQKVSYMYGRHCAEMMTTQQREGNYDFDFDSVLEGFKDANAGTVSKIAEADAQALTTKLNQEFEARKKAKKEGQPMAVDATETKKVSYLFGRQLDEYIKNRFRIFDFDSVLAGFKEANAGTASKIAVADFQALEAKVRQETEAKQQVEREAKQKEMAAAAIVNKEAGKKFLEENGKREGVTVTESGLQYEVLNKVEGAKPAYNGYILAHYHGTLLDGTVIDGSVKRGEPILTGVSRIPGWSEGVELMSEGSKYKLFIPSELAYGDENNGNTPEIGPGQTLIYEIELVKIFSSTEEAQAYHDKSEEAKKPKE